MKKGLITLLPFFIAREEPKRFPKIEKMAQIIPSRIKTFLYIKNVINAATFEDKLTTFAFADDVVISKCNKAVYTKIKKVPVPGPKKPSYIPIIKLEIAVIK